MTPEECYRAGRFDDADRACRAALAAEPDDLDTLVGAGLVATLYNRLDEAKTLLTQAMERDPDNLRVLGELTEIAYRQDDSPPRPTRSAAWQHTSTAPRTLMHY